MNGLMNMQLALPSGSLQTYIQSVNQIQMLSAEEELEFAKCYRDSGDLEAARKLGLAHLRFVVRVANGYGGYGYGYSYGGEVDEEGEFDDEFDKNTKHAA